MAKKVKLNIPKIEQAYYFSAADTAAFSKWKQPSIRIIFWACLFKASVGSVLKKEREQLSRLFYRTSLFRKTLRNEC